MLCPLERGYVTSLLLLVTALDTLVLDGIFGLKYEFSLSPVSTCEMGLLDTMDDILVFGRIENKGKPEMSSAYRMDVQATRNNVMFRNVCSTIIKPADCKPRDGYGCFCTKSGRHGQVLDLMVKEIATCALSEASFRIRLEALKNNKQYETTLKIPKIYGDPVSNVTIEQQTYLLTGYKTCQFVIEDLFSDVTITFCTSNLNSPVQTVTVDKGGIFYFVNQACGKHTFSNASWHGVQFVNLTYSDKCWRHESFICEILADVQPVIMARVDIEKGNLVAIITGSCVAILLFLNIVISMFRGKKSDANRHRHHRHNQLPQHQTVLPYTQIDALGYSSADKGRTLHDKEYQNLKPIKVKCKQIQEMTAPQQALEEKKCSGSIINETNNS